MPSAGVNLPKPSGESYQLHTTRAGPVNCRITATRPGALRIVRLLPACAQLSNLVDLDGQGLGNPRGGNRGNVLARSAVAVCYGDSSDGVAM